MLYTGIWIDWNGPWNSALKMHAAGYLIGSDGSLDGRGSSGHFWTTYYFILQLAERLAFDGRNCGMYQGNKTYGMSLRCIRE